MSRIYTLSRPSRRSSGIDYRGALNDEQYEAVTSPPGPCLVIAGAGSGKTRTLTYRVAWLIDQGLLPSRILLLTFTNKAAREMLERVSSLVQQDLTSLWGGTFHHVGHRILRTHPREAGLEQGFTILDRDDAQEVLTSLYSRLEINAKDKRFPRPSVALEIISYSENTNRAITELCEKEFSFLAEFVEPLIRIQSQYRQRKYEINAVDYDDLLTLPLKILKQNPLLAERYQFQFQAILVDEFQDTNAVQSQFIDYLAAHHRHLMVVGDDAQSIYSWRGARFENILSFPERYPDARIFRIRTNYRSVPEILSLANMSIAANTRQFPKELRAVKPSGNMPVLVPAADPHQQANFVCQRIIELQNEGYNLSEMAVLYRAHSHAIELQLELTKRNIPFVITSGIQFFQQAHVKDLAAHLRIAINPADEIAFLRVASLVPGIGATTAQKLFSTLKTGKSWHLANPPKKSATVWVRLATLISQLRQETSVKLKPAPAAIAQDSTTQVELPPEEMINVILETYYCDVLQLRYDNASQRLEDLRQLRDYSRQFTSTSEFLAQLTLLTGVELARPSNAPADADTLRLTTVHQAKGLEWKIVFLIHLADGLFPLARSTQECDSLEEERRLFYVAVTRAQDQLYLTYPIIRLSRGQFSLDPIQRKSRFIEEIPHHLMEQWQIEPPRPDWSNTTAAPHSLNSTTSAIKSPPKQYLEDHCSDPAPNYDEPF